MSVLVLDVDVASLSIKGQLAPSLDRRITLASVVCVTFVTVGELVRWAEM